MKKVLLVDDYKDWLEVEKEFIERFNDAECITFDRPIDALRYLRQGNKVDVVITDYQMPGMDGFMLSAHIDSEFPDIRIIISSGYDISELKKIRHGIGLEDEIEIISKDNTKFLENLFDEK